MNKMQRKKRKAKKNQLDTGLSKPVETWESRFGRGMETEVTLQGINFGPK